MNGAHRFFTGLGGILPLLFVLPLAACDSSSTEPDPPTPNIVETAEAAGSFTTLLAALDAADLTSTLANGGPFTVFAPTDEAFAQIPEEDLNALLADVEALTAVLTYHVVAGELSSGEVVAQSSIATLNGASVQVSVEGDAVRIDDAGVVTTDIEAANGIIHVIDAVLLPPQD